MNFFNLSRSATYSDFSEVGVDMHSHLIPGVDDGARNVQESVALVEGLHELGFTHLFTTPHTFTDLYPNTSDSINSGLRELEPSIPAGIELGVSSEYYLDEQFIFLLKANSVLPLPGARLLIEFSPVSMPLALQQFIKFIKDLGYNPILAHPERYPFFFKRLDYLGELKEMGVEFQVNALSLVGHYGSGVRNFAEQLIDIEYIDFLGTDLHNIRQLEVLKTVPGTKYFKRLIESKRLKNQLFNIPITNKTGFVQT